MERDLTALSQAWVGGVNESFTANGLVPYQYLQFVFETLPTLGEQDDLEALLPWRWKETLPL